MIDRLLSNVAVVADNATQPPVSPRTPSLPTQTTHPSVSRRSSLRHPSRTCEWNPLSITYPEMHSVQKKNVDDALPRRKASHPLNKLTAHTVVSLAISVQCWAARVRSLRQVMQRGGQPLGPRRGADPRWDRSSGLGRPEFIWAPSALEVGCATDHHYRLHRAATPANFLW